MLDFIIHAFMVCTLLVVVPNPLPQANEAGNLCSTIHVIYITVHCAMCTVTSVVCMQSVSDYPTALHKKMSKFVESACIGALLQDTALFLGVPAIFLIRKRLQVCGVRRIEESEVIKLARVRGGIRFQPHQLQITTTLLLNRLNANCFHVIVRVLVLVIVIFIGIIIVTSLSRP